MSTTLQPTSAAPGAAASEPLPDDPADPTDQTSGDVAPLEDPVTGEPSGEQPGGQQEPPVAPPADPQQ